MNAKHTPGPWHIRQGGDGTDPQAYDVFAGSVPIARGFWRGKCDVVLCAAAPDLLAALESLVERGTDSPEHMAAERAIARARGE